ncbi:MAG: hypothetical protein ABIN01_13430, partial [Ferruginibacter sp.]
MVLINSRRLLLIWIWFFVSTSGVVAQSSYYDILPINGNTSFSYNQTPETLTSLVAGITGVSFQWQSSPLPLSGFNDIAGATLQTYSFPGALSNTMFYRRLTTNAQNVTYT